METVSSVDWFFNVMQQAAHYLLYVTVVCSVSLSLVFAGGWGREYSQRYGVALASGGKAIVIALGGVTFLFWLLLAGIYDQGAMLGQYILFTLCLTLPTFPVLGRKPKIVDIAIIVAVGIMATCLYYFMMDKVSPWLLCVSAALVGGLAWSFRTLSKNKDVSSSPLLRPSVVWAINIFCALMAVVIFVGWIINLSAWMGFAVILLHHWSVYVLAGQNLLAGLIPFYDFPVQYGFGPAVTMAAGCALAGCWSSMFWLTVFIEVAYLVALCTVLRLSWRKAVPWLFAVDLVIAFIAVFIWVGTPEKGFAAFVFPSTGGWRFLPLLLLMLALYADRIKIAYIIAAVCVWWSPEMVIMTGMVMAVHELHRIGWRAAAARLGLVYGVSACAFLAFFCLYWGVFPDPAAYFEYFVHVPGPLNPELAGPLWTFFGIVVLGFYCLVRERDDAECRRHLVAFMGFLAAGLYCLGRTHNQSFDNLMPFIIILAYRFFRLHGSDDTIAPALKAQMLAAILIVGAYVASIEEPFMSLRLGVMPLVGAEREMESAFVSKLERKDVGVIFIPSGIHSQSLVPLPKWMPIDSWVAYSFVPSARRVIYLRRWMERHPDLPQQACLIVGEDVFQSKLPGSADLLDGYTEFYKAATVRDVGKYKLIGLTRWNDNAASTNDPCRMRG